MSDNIVRLADRVKEISYTMGTGNLALAGAVAGFASFGTRLQSGDNLFYAVTDGTAYEVGSGVFLDSPYDQLVRFPIVSSNGNNRVSFGEGVKEVYVTYPASHAVYMGSGVSNLNTPNTNQVGFWASPNVMDADSQLVWDKTNKFFGINTANPNYGLELGGFGTKSMVKASGAVLGSSGIYFQPHNSYSGGRQVYHYEPTQLDQYAFDNLLLGHLTGSDAVLELSGVANQYLLFKKQNAGLVFAGPASGCTPPCSPDYPGFRQLTYEDIPAIGEVSGILNNKFLTLIGSSNSTATAISGILNNKIDSVSGLFSSFAATLDGDRGDIVVSSSGTTWVLDNNSVTTAKLLDTSVTSAKLAYSNSYIATGRLTLSSGQPLPDDVTDSASLHYHPYNGNIISLYNTGTGRWDTINFSTTTLNLASMSANTNYDIFGYNNSGTLVLESTAWLNGITRSVNIVTQDGVYCKSGALSRRYLGTIRTGASGVTSDSASQRLVWNVQNRIPKKLLQASSTGPWTYSTASWRALNNTVSSVKVVAGLNSTIDISAGVLFAAPQSGATLFYFLSIAGSGSTTPISNGTHHQSYNDAVQVQLDARYIDKMIGYETYYPVEYVNATGVSATLYGGENSSYFGGIRGTWEC